MWLFTLNSFVSIVRHRQEHDTLLVRARRREDLLTLLGHAYDNKISEDRNADYPWRVLMKENDFQTLINDYITKKLEYDNFKAAQSPDPKFEHFLHKVWAEGFRLQR